MSTRLLTLMLRLAARDDASRPARDAMRRIARAREQLGMRSERMIQREIDRTGAAYRRLARSGQLSFNEQIRAARQARQRIAELNRELGRTPMLQRAAQTVAGVVAAKAVVAPVVGRTMNYSQSLAHATNTAFRERDVAGRIAGKRELDAAVQEAVRRSGSTREQALEALNSIISSGAVQTGDAITMLPAVMRASVAANADPTEMATIGVRAMQSFGVSADRLAKVFDMALTAGQLGGFEVRDMARDLPSQLAQAANLGMRGERDLAFLLAANQMAAITAGTPAQAGLNMQNLLSKINSPDTAADFKKLGIDLSDSLAAKQARGLNAIEAFMELVDEVVSRDQRFVALKKQAASATGGERREILDRQTTLLQGSVIGRVLQDRQALLGFLGLMNDRQQLQSIMGGTMTSSGATDKNMAVLESEPGFRVGSVVAEGEIALQKAFEGINKSIGETAQKLADYAQKYPDLTANLALATTSLATLAAAATAAGVVGGMMGGRGGGLLAGTAALLGGGRAMLARAGGTILGGGRALLARAGGTILGSSVGALTGAGAIGTGITAGLGGLSLLSGYQIGKDFNARAQGTPFMDWLDSSVANPIADAIDSIMGKEINLAVTVDVKGGNIVAEVNKANSREAKRY